MLDFLCDKKEYEKWIRSTYRKPKDWDDDKATQSNNEDKKLSPKGHMIIDNFIKDKPIDAGLETLEEQDIVPNDQPKKLSEKGQLVLENFADDLPIFTRNEERKFGKLSLDKFKLQAYQGLLQVQAKLLSLAGVSEPAKTLQDLIREKIDDSRVDQITSLVLEGPSDKSTRNKSFLNRFKEHLNGFQQNLIDVIKNGLGALSLDKRTKLREEDIPDYDKLKDNTDIFKVW